MARARLPEPLVDGLIVLAISGFAAAGSGSQPWTGFNSPDSEFYATLALHGSDVADRALDPAYTWTRLGYIAPVRLLVTTMDPFVGFWLWRFILIVAIVGSLYAIVRLTSTRQLAVIVAAFAGINTMVLSFVGNTYLTGTVLALTSVLLALAVWGALGSPSRAWLPALASGVVAGWLLMTNPYGLLLGMSMWLAVRGVAWVHDRSWRAVGRDGLLGIAGFATSTAAFLAAGAVIFPGRNWLETYLTWNDRLDYASFIGDRDVWQRDIGLLVPVVAVAIAVVAAVATRSRVAVVSVVVAVTNIAFTAGYFLLVPGPWLEAPTYVAVLWPGALTAIAIAFGALVVQRSLGAWGWVTAAALLPIALWAGRWDSLVTNAVGIAVATVMVALVVVAALALRGRSVAAAGIATVVAVAGVAVGSQVLQNGRGMLGTYGQFPLRAAFVDFDAELLMRSKVAAQEFVLANTTTGRPVVTWADADRLTAGIAAMQLWGWYNAVSTSATLAAAEADRLRELRPDAVAMYAPTRDQISAFWASLPSDAHPGAPQCTSVPFLGIGSPEAHVCVVRLSWSD